MDSFSAKSISYTVNCKSLLQETSINFKRGEFTVILGANGAGKTTLLKCLTGLTTPSTGHIALGERNLKKICASERAKLISYIPQNPALAWPTSVRNVVALGRLSYGSMLSGQSDADALAVETALHECDIYHLSHQSVETLSGGELARVHFARALSSHTPFLLADEPTSSLDIAHQLRAMKLFQNYTTNGGGAIVVLHDTTLAANNADRIVWMKNGVVVSDGTPEKTVTSETMKNIFNVNTLIDWYNNCCTIRLI